MMMSMSDKIPLHSQTYFLPHYLVTIPKTNPHLINMGFHGLFNASKKLQDVFLWIRGLCNTNLQNIYS